MIEENVKKILDELPTSVELVAASKTRTPEEILQAIQAGIKIIGQNYVQEAQKAYSIIGQQVKWHFIGHLQRNKVKKAVEIFDMIETIDSIALASEIDKQCRRLDKIMPILIEINSGREQQKYGIFPEDMEDLTKKISGLKNIKIQGLMTMGPMFGNPEDARPYFIETKKIFDKIRTLDIPDIEMKYLSMGMTNSYLVAVEEGANLVRIGSKIFGPHNY